MGYKLKSTTLINIQLFIIFETFALVLSVWNFMVFAMDMEMNYFNRFNYYNWLQIAIHYKINIFLAIGTPGKSLGWANRILLIELWVIVKFIKISLCYCPYTYTLQTVKFSLSVFFFISTLEKITKHTQNRKNLRQKLCTRERIKES